MKSVSLKYVAIKNFRSIIDSKKFFLPDDGITVLVGQNESGKTSIIDALEAFGSRKLDSEDRNVTRHPTSITCTFRFSLDYLEHIFEDHQSTLDYLEYHLNEGILDVEIEVSFPVGKNTGVLAINSPNFAEPAIATKSGTDEKVATTNTASAAEAGETQNEVESTTADILKPAEIQKILLEKLPKISLFKDDSLLPRQILLNDIENETPKTDGIKGAKNFLKVLGVDMTRLKEDIASPTSRLTLEEELNRDFTADFNEFWTQEVVEGNRATVHIALGAVRAGLPNAGADQLTFTVETKKRHLFPDQRSKGFQWFLSFYLQLMVLRDDQANILLLDEPGAHLHIKAKENLLKVLEEVKENAQIIYTTHEPELIKLEQLHRIKVVSQTAEVGTIIETVEHAASRSGAADALSPIYRAMGANFSGIPLANKNNILLEEPSAFYYLQAWRKLLGLAEKDIFLLPAMGVNSVPVFVNLLTGWGFNFKVVLDDDHQGREVYKQIVESWTYSEEDKKRRLYRLDPGPIIEAQFTGYDYQKWIMGRNEEKIDKKSTVMDLVRSNKEGKALSAKKFLEQVEKGEIKKQNFEKQTVSNFESIFNFINSA